MTLNRWARRLAGLLAGLALTGPLDAQTLIPAPAASGVTAVTCGTGLSGGTITTSGTCALSTPVAASSGGSGAANTGALAWNASQTLAFTAGQTMTFPSASTTLAGLGTAQSFTAAQTISVNNAASTPPLLLTGTVYTNGGTTNTLPSLYVNPGSVTSSAWNNGGTLIGANVASAAFNGNLIDTQVDGASKFKVDATGAITSAGATLTASSAAGSFLSLSTANGGLTLAAADKISWTGRGILSSQATGQIRLGATDSASPVAQTLNVPGVSAGNTDGAGASLTIAGGRGTGAGLGGAVIIQTAPSSTTGNTQNALVTSTTWGSSGGITVAAPVTPLTSASAIQVTASPYTAGTATTNFPLVYIDPASTNGTTWSTAGTLFGANAASAFTGNLADLQLNAASLFKVDYQGNLTWSGNALGGAAKYIGWNGRGLLSSPAAGQIQLGNADAAAPVAQTLKAQSVVAGTSNTAGQTLTIAGSAGTGTGAGGKIQFQTAVTGTTGTTQNAQQTVLAIDTNQHMQLLSAAAPTATCGTSPTVTSGSTDVAGQITTGTTTTTCTVTFKIAFAAAPFCAVADQSALANLTSYTVSTSAITMTMTSNSGNVVTWHCFGA